MHARRDTIRILVLASALAPLVLACSRDEAPTGPPTFVGRASCAECHVDQVTAYRGSDHDRAMEEADASTVLGDFSDVTVTHFGSKARFFKDGAKFLVETDGPDGKPTRYEISYTFGFRPLQQYLVKFPRGRMQCLPFAWDTRPKELGGQRWFHLYPDEEIRHDDELHWTGPNQNWNFMCADCHSTNLRKNYDLASDTHATTYSEIDVSCEACHGPASRHLAWARDGEDPKVDKGILKSLHADSRFSFNQGPTAQGTPGDGARRQTEACGRCHSRRTTLDEGPEGEWLLDTHRTAVLSEGLYHPDGQIQDEVYVYGSFVQSKMHHAGVTCTDCHDPHSLKLRGEGNQSCIRCHQAPAYDTPKHHHHEIGTAGAACVSCHMPARTYMVVDPRRDHSIRVPRPDLSATLGTPNACNGCHQDKTPSWAFAAIRSWKGTESDPPRHFATTLHAARLDPQRARPALLELALDPGAPTIARATALSLLDGRPDRSTDRVLTGALASDDPLLRFYALNVLEDWPAQLRTPRALALLEDDVRIVRMQAARILADAPRDSFSPAQQEAFVKALDEYLTSQELHGDRAFAQLNLGNLFTALGRVPDARRAFERAIALQPRFVAGYANLADLLGRAGDEAGCVDALSRGLRAVPGDPALLHARGLSAVRSKRYGEALRDLRAAAQARPDMARYAYLYAVALHSTGKAADAMTWLADAHRRHPADRDILAALATYHRDADQRHEALRYAKALLALDPEDVMAQRLVEQLRGR